MKVLLLLAEFFSASNGNVSTFGSWRWTCYTADRGHGTPSPSISELSSYRSFLLPEVWGYGWLKFSLSNFEHEVVECVEERLGHILLTCFYSAVSQVNCTWPLSKEICSLSCSSSLHIFFGSAWLRTSSNAFAISAASHKRVVHDIWSCGSLVPSAWSLALKLVNSRALKELVSLPPPSLQSVPWCWFEAWYLSLSSFSREVRDSENTEKLTQGILSDYNSGHYQDSDSHSGT